jgi:hypothetical protein
MANDGWKTMSDPWVETVCLLCGAPASVQKTDTRMRSHYVCSGAPPGEYVITDTAIRKLEQSAGLRARALVDAHRERDPEEILDISVDLITQQVTFEVVKRRTLGINRRVV